LTITELIKLITQNIQLMHHIKQVESGINRKLRGISRGNLNERQEGLLGLRQIRSDGSHDSQAGRLECMSSGKRQSKGDC
jgi:hypothetical protein